MLAFLIFLTFWLFLSALVIALLFAFDTYDELAEANTFIRWWLCWLMAPSIAVILTVYREWWDLKNFVAFLLTAKEPE